MLTSGLSVLGDWLVPDARARCDYTNSKQRDIHSHQSAQKRLISQIKQHLGRQKNPVCVRFIFHFLFSVKPEARGHEEGKATERHPPASKLTG